MTATITAFFPAMDSLSVAELDVYLAKLRACKRLRPFSHEAEKLTADFAHSLLQDEKARRYPELQALGFWLRPAAVAIHKQGFALKSGTIAVPQGVVFHIPPANVDTIFAYSLFMSLLAGNANILRLPSRRGPAMELLLKLITHVFKNASEILRDQLLILGYDHDAGVTETISRAVDMRVIWGSDKTVETLRAIPLAPWGREMVFPDRFSWSAFKVAAYAALDDAARQELAEHYFNDLFWFDQNGCASPRAIVWCGKKNNELTVDFYNRVASIATSRQWRLDEGGAVLKQTRNYACLIDQEIEVKRDFGSVLTVFSVNGVAQVAGLRDAASFGGTLFEFFIPELLALTPVVGRRDQTLGCFGFSATELEDFARSLSGRGFDRMVPIGQALTFEAVWDGYDLMQGFTRLVTLRA